MSPLIVASTILSLTLYLPLCWLILKGKSEQNFATWLLWGALDGITAATLIVQNGNYAMTVAYTIGSLITVLCIARRQPMAWTRFESFVTFLVFLCLVVWWSAGAWTATIAGTLAVCVASIPQIAHTYREPIKMPVLIFAGYFVANLLSFLGGKSWSVEERFYPGCAAILCVILVVVALSRRFSLKTTNKAAMPIGL